MEENTIKQGNNEKSLSIGELFFLAKKNIILILIITVACTLIGGIYGLVFKEKSYTATSTVMIMVDTSKDTLKSTNEYNAYMYSTYLINTYKDFLSSHKVVDRAIESLGSYDYNLSYESVTKNLELSSGEYSLVVTVSYVAHGDNDEEKTLEAQRVVNALIKSSIDIANTEMNQDGETYTYATLRNAISQIDPASKEFVVAKRGAAIIIIVSFLVGIVISFAIVLIKYLTDDTFKSKDEFKRIFGIDVIASIPEINEVKGESK